MKCTTCNGKGNIYYMGNEYPCTSCNGKGKK